MLQWPPEDSKRPQWGSKGIQKGSKIITWRWASKKPTMNSKGKPTKSSKGKPTKGFKRFQKETYQGCVSCVPYGSLVSWVSCVSLS